MIQGSSTINPKRASHKKWTRARREKHTADSFVTFKPSASPATEQLIGQFTADDRSVSDQGASLAGVKTAQM